MKTKEDILKRIEADFHDPQGTEKESLCSFLPYVDLPEALKKRLSEDITDKWKQADIDNPVKLGTITIQKQNYLEILEEQQYLTRLVKAEREDFAFLRSYRTSAILWVYGDKEAYKKIKNVQKAKHSTSKSVKRIQSAIKVFLEREAVCISQE